ncbi:MAG: DUF721 domain-containing protein [Actinomycetes bacterium]|jgi:hypothetical protein|nr:DUF721 domain-containing protein [Actinomycetes bacterium]
MQADDIEKISETTPLAVVLDRLVERNDPDGTRGHVSAAVREHIERIIGPAATEALVTCYIRERELVFEVKEAAWAHSLAYFGDEYCRALNEDMGADLVERVRCMVKPQQTNSSKNI